MNARDLPDIGIPTSAYLPPHSVEAEQGVLGGLLLDNAAWERIADMLTEADFYLADHRTLFQTMRAMFGRGEPVDVITLATAIEARGEAERVGLGYVVALASGTPSAANIARYAGIVRERSAAREMLAASNRLSELAHDVALGADERIERATAEVLRLAAGVRSGREATTLKDALRDAIEAIDERARNPGAVSGLATGFLAIDDETCGLQPGDLVIVDGRPSMGKTTLATNIAENVALAGGGVFFASLEMSAAQLAERSLARFGSVPTQAMRKGQLAQRDYDGLVVSTGRLRDAPMMIQDDPAAISTVGRLRMGAIKARQRFGRLDLIVIDYLQLMRADGNTRNEELGSITRGLKLMAKELGCPVILLSQLSRKCEERTDKRPHLSDLRESGSIEQDADVVLMAYRDEYYTPESSYKGLAEILIRKQRMGPLGTVYLRFEGQFSRFSDAMESDLAIAAQTNQKPFSKKYRDKGFRG